MGSLNDLASRQALAIGEMMLSSGTVSAVGMPQQAKGEPRPLTNEEMLAREEALIREGNRASVEEQLRSGNYMPIGSRHASNFDTFTQRAGSSGFTAAQVVLDTQDNNTEPNSRIVPTGQGTATVVVNEAAIRATPEFTRDLADHRVQHGSFIPLGPETALNHGSMVQAARDAGFSAPPRVVLDVVNTSETPQMNVSALPDGTPLVRVNVMAHDWTSQFARDRVMQRDEDFTRQVAEGRLVAASGRMDPSVTQYLQESAARRGLSDIGAYVDMSSSQSTSVYAEAMETAGGRRYVAINEAFLQLKPEQQRAVIDHELAHFQLGHTTAQARAEQVNAMRGGDHTLSARAEAYTDRVAVCHAHDPQVTARHLADTLRVMGDTHVQEFRNRGNRNATVREAMDALRERDRTHPPLEQRVRDVQEYSGSCSEVAPLSTPKGAVTGGSRHK